LATGGGNLDCNAIYPNLWVASGRQDSKQASLGRLPDIQKLAGDEAKELFGEFGQVIQVD
jgi:hypothetical protein